MKVILLFLLCLLISCGKQEKHNNQSNFTLGLTFDNDSYQNVPMKAKLTRSLYSVPQRISLRKYLPKISSQGDYSTCVGWSSAYYARTILWAKRKKLSGSQITENTFSPSFVYKMIGGNSGCSIGTQIEKALTVMASTGVPLYKDFSEQCPSDVPSEIQEKSSDYKIENFVTLFSPNDSKDVKVNATKKALSEGNPVIIGMGVTLNFMNERDDVYSANNDSHQDIKGGHAMCIVGYDDNKEGGAFEIANSWGTEWGSDGFIWVKYKDYANFTFQAFEMIDNIKSTPEVEDSEYLSGKMRFILSDDSEMKANSGKMRGLEVDDEEVDNDNPIEKEINYKIAKAYTSGTKFRLLLSNNQPAYVYAIATDKTMKITQLFPHNKETSAALTYSKNEVPLPSETDYIKMDNTKGNDIFCLLYSKEELNITKLMSDLGKQKGSFAKRLQKILNNRLVSPDDIEYATNEIAFKAKTSKEQVIVPIIVAIPHK
jgi:hypothetical protein